MQAQGRALPSADAVTLNLLAEVNSSEPSACVNQQTPFVGVGHAAHDMTPAEREAAAYRAGCAMQAWYSRYQATGNRADLDIAYQHLGQMVAILKGRSREVIARMEQERGLS